jgi:putative component of membrane protein insertase Oxa1/YidC/SpoIIIJ protein YidD
MATMSPHQPTSNIVARLPRLLGRALILFYRYTLLALIGPRCRHLPSCSEYAEEAVVRFGLWAGAWAALPPRAHWWMPWRYGRWRGTNDQPPVN